MPYNGDATDQDFALVCYNCVASTSPGFGVVVLPAEQRTCQSGTASFEVRATALNGFSGPVTLTAAGHPTGTSASFSPNPVNAGAVSTLTIGNTVAAPAGSYVVTVTGSAGTETAAAAAELAIDAALGPVSLVSPEAGGSASTRPTFTWTAVPGAATYTLQVSLDSTFATVAYAASGLVDTSHLMRSGVSLALGTYYWRVRAVNACGGRYSSARSFTTWGVFQGRVTDASTGSGLANVGVTIYDATGGYVGSSWTDSTGRYVTDSLQTGAYYAVTSSSGDYVDELYNNIPCPSRTCTVTAGAKINVVAGSMTNGIAFALARGGRMGGTVTSGSGSPISGAWVQLFDSAGNWVGSARTENSGAYTSAALPAGDYFARTFNSAGYLDELYDDLPCVGSCTVTSGTRIRVTASQTTQVAFALASGGRIAGAVRSSGGDPLPDVTLTFYDASGRWAGNSFTDATGNYVSGGLPDGAYYVRTLNSRGYLDEVYDDVPCPGGSCAASSGRPVVVTAASTATGVDFTLDPGGRIRGTVRDAAGVALANVWIYFYDANGNSMGSAYTDTAGAFVSSGFPSGTYHARTSNSQGYLDEIYEDLLCSSQSCTVTAGTPISVAAPNTTTAVDFVLAAGGRITGSVRNASGAALPNVWISFYDSTGSWAGSATTSASGTYTSTGLPSGTYYVRTSNDLGYLDEVYNDVVCPGGACNVTGGTPVPLAAPATVTGVDFVLATGGRISGTVKNASGAPLAGVTVTFLGASGQSVGSVSTDATGAFTSTSLPSGTYFARTYNTLGYLDELYDDLVCPGGSCSATGGKAITVTAPNTTTGIDFTLAAGGRISGTARNGAGAPISATLHFYDSSGNWAGYANTDSSGAYVSAGLPSGSYRVTTSNWQGYVDEAYDDLPCPGGSCNITAGTPVAVTASATTSGIDFVLAPGARIGGRVVDMSGAPLRNVAVRFYDAAGISWGSAYTDESGFYQTSGMPSGTYYANTANWRGYLDVLYDGVPCPGGSCGRTGGTPITVTAPETKTGVDFTLAAGGRISGTVRSASGVPLPNVSVEIYDLQGRWSGSAMTDAAGTYLSGVGLETGSYRLRTYNRQGYIDEVYDNLPCPNGACSVSAGTPIAVVMGATSAGIDFALAPNVQPVFWRNLVGVTASANSLTKTATTTGWDAGASSTQVMPADGFVEFTALETTLRRFVGLNHEDASPSQTEIDYAVFLKNDATFAVFESGTSRGILGSYATGDRFRVAVESGVVKYYRNGTLFYTSGVAPTFPLWVDTSLGDPNSTVQDAVVFAMPGAPGPPVAVIQAPVSGRVGTPLTFDGSGSWDPDGSIVTYRWEFGDGGTASGPTVMHAYAAPGPFTVTLTVTDNGAQSDDASQSEQISQAVFWRNLVGVTASGNSLTKTSTTTGWNAGASSVQAMPADGFVEFTAQETTLRRFVGLNHEDAGPSQTEIDYAFFLKNDATFLVYESGTSRGSLGNYATGDRFRIAVESGVVKYYQNGRLFYTSGVAPTFPLWVDTSLGDPNSTVKDVVLFAMPGAPGPPVAVIQAPVSGRVGTPITFDGSGSWDPDGWITSYQWTFGDGGTASGPTVTHTFAAPGQFTVSLTVTDNSWQSNEASQSEQISQVVFWRNLVGVTASGNSLTKTATTTGWDAGASSTQPMPADGFVEFTAQETTLRRFVGLNREDAGPSQTEIDYAVFLKNDATFAVFESGTSRGILGSYATGDRFRIAVESGVVQYYRNGTVFYTSGVAPTFPLWVDTSLGDPNSTVKDVVVFAAPGAPGPPVAVIQAPVSGRVGTPLTFDGGSSWDPDGSIASYDWEFGDGGTASGPTVMHAFGTAGRHCVTLTVTDDDGTSSSSTRCVDVFEPVVWQSLVGVTASGGNLTKTGMTTAWDAGASSVQAMSGDGFLEFTAQETTLRRFAGLNHEDAGPSHTELDYAVFLKHDATFLVYESGTSRGSFGSYAAGDRFRIAVESGVVKYYRNGALFYTSGVAPAFPLWVDTSFYEPGSTLKDAVIFTP